MNVERVKELICNYGLTEYTDWNNQKICNIPFNELNTIDFRKKRGREVKDKYKLEPKKVKKIFSTLYDYSLSVPKPITFEYTSEVLSSIQCIKSYILRWWVLYQIENKGKYFYGRHLLSNKQDPITLENCSNIGSKYFFVLKQNDKYYGIDIRNLEKMIENKMKNPFTNEEFTPQIVDEMNYRLNKIKLLGISTQLAKAHVPTKLLDKIKARVVELFQAIDALDNYTDIYWFLRLNISQLKLWYLRAEDIWNYRTQLTIDQQKAIVPDCDVHVLFPAKHTINNIHNLSQLRMMVLDVMERLVTSSPKRSERVLGAMYVLSALTECSHEVAVALPWLFQPPT